MPEIPERLLTVGQVAELLATSERFLVDSSLSGASALSASAATSASPSRQYAICCWPGRLSL